jgi:hypothetical protein
MESSRSGLLSTLLMTLPLIVVPAIALLRPPGQMPSVSTTPLEATDDSAEELLDEFDIVESESEPRKTRADRETDVASEEFDELFAESPSVSNSRSADADRSLKRDSTEAFDKDLSNPFDLEESSDDSLTEQQTPKTTGGAERIVEELNVNGALRTMWFEAGSRTPVGFAAFFRGQTELTRIRFEAVGQSREECARNVLNQVRQWQAEQAVE